MRAFLAVVAVAVAASASAADVLYLRDGDRISGRILGETSRSVRIETAYGRLVVPLRAIERIQREGRPERVMKALPSDAPPPPHPPRGVRLVLVVLGKTFWQAWDPKDPPADSTLRMEVRVDEEPVATFVDGALDPDEIPKAMVNAFSFAPADVAIKAAAAVEVTPPEVRPGRIVLKMDLPAARVGDRLVRVAYQGNDGTAAEPEWRDLAEGSLTVALTTASPTFIQLRQDPGRMEFSGFPRRKMKRVETFVIDPIVE